MARFSYDGPFRNPAENLGVFLDPNDGLYYRGRKVPCECGCPNCTATLLVKANPNDEGSEDAGDVAEAIDDEAEFFEQDYDQYLDENHHAIARMEAYEMWRNEY